MHLTLDFTHEKQININKFSGKVFVLLNSHIDKSYRIRFWKQTRKQYVSDYSLLPL